MNYALILLLLLASMTNAGWFFKSKKQIRKYHQLQEQYLTRQIEPPSKNRNFWRKIKNLLTCSSEFDAEWTDTPKQVLPNMKEIEAQMQEVDNYFCKLERDRLLKAAQLMIFAPSALANVDLVNTQTTFNPMLYKNGYYSIVFQVGDLYPFYYPYLSVYVTVCNQPHRGIASEGLHLRTFYVYNNRTVADQLVGDDNRLWKSKSSNLLHKTADDSWVFEWHVPEGQKLKDRKDYCFAFNMQKINPNASPYVKQLIHKDREQDIRKFKKISHKNHLLHTIRFFHKYQASSLFGISKQPNMFTEAWFYDQFGGEDLKLFMGGDMVAFKEFALFYYGEDSNYKLPKSMLLDYVREKGKNVANWFKEVIIMKENGVFEQNRWSGRWKVKYQNNGYDLLKFRQNAQSRAAGLLYHPQGKATLKQIGLLFLEVANKYEKTLQPMHFWKNIVDRISNFLFNLRNFYINGFKNARARLADATRQLKREFNELPTSEDFEARATMDRNGMTLGFEEGSTRKIVTIRNKIVKAVRDMLLFEIRLTLIAMGNRLMIQESRINKIMDGMVGISNYDTSYYANIASAIKVYGTKFVNMANEYKVTQNFVYDCMLQQSQLWEDVVTYNTDDQSGNENENVGELLNDRKDLFDMTDKEFEQL